MKYLSANVLSASDTTSQTSAKIDSEQLVGASFHAYFGDSTEAGTIQIQASNDVCDFNYLANSFTPTNWVNIPSATGTSTAGSPVLISLPVSNGLMSFRWLRVVYTNTTPGTSTINVNIFAVAE